MVRTNPLKRERNRPRPRLVIGLTGGIGSGKSIAAHRFAELGVPVIDTDEIAHALVEAGGPALARITARFGAGILAADGTLNRARLREIVFDDARAREDLEAILHPPIHQEVLQRLAEIQTPYAIVVIPLLLETGQTDLVDRILVVDVPKELQVQRVMQRSGLEQAQVLAIIEAQCSRDERLANADDIIDNSADIGFLREQVDRFHRYYLDRTVEHTATTEQ